MDEVSNAPRAALDAVTLALRALHAAPAEAVVLASVDQAAAQLATLSPGLEL